MRINKKKLKTWLNENASSVKVIYGEEFCYSLVEQQIIFSKELPLHIDWYIKFCKNRLGLKYDVNKYILCLLHEIGHDQTLFFIEDYKHDIDFFLSKFVETESYFKFISWIKCQIYFRMPCELEATKWSIDFINNNIDKVRELEGFLY